MPERKKKIRQGRLYPEALAIAKRETLEDLCKKSGLPLSWLRKFRGEEIKSPSVQRIETLLTAYGVKVELVGI